MAEPEAVRILVVDDDDAGARLASTVLVANGYPAPIRASTGAEALLRASEADIVLLDHQLPDMSGKQVLEALRTTADPPAVLMVTGAGSESLAASLFRQGADDYLVKDPSLARLLPQAVERVRRLRLLRRRLAAAEREVVRTERLAAIGEMTVTLHHEINNPLMSASAEVELLLTGRDPLTEEQRAGLETVKAMVGRIRDVLRRAGQLRSAESTAYLDGVAMIDLAHQAGEAPGVLLGRALIHVPEEDLARVTQLLLRHAGFAVERCHSAAELRASAERGEVRLVLVAGGPEAAAGFPPSDARSYRLVALLGTGAPGQAVRAGADHAIPLPFDPERFIAEVTGSPAP